MHPSSAWNKTSSSAASSCPEAWVWLAPPADFFPARITTFAGVSMKRAAVKCRTKSKWFQPRDRRRSKSGISCNPEGHDETGQGDRPAEQGRGSQGRRRRAGRVRDHGHGSARARETEGTFRDL